MKSHQAQQTSSPLEAAPAASPLSSQAEQRSHLDIMQLQKSLGNKAVMQLLSRRNANMATTTHVIQRALTLDNADFSGVNKIKSLGGAQGAYLVEDGSGQVVVKVTSEFDGTVMAYNLAKDFGVKIPSARHLNLNTEAGQALIAKAGVLNRDLEGKLRSASAIIIWQYIPGDILGDLRKKKDFDADNKDDVEGEKVRSEKVKTFKEKPENFVELGRMLVFDAAIMNGDRFKIETGAHANSGNLMIADNHPVGLDQEFANIDFYSNFEETVNFYGKGFRENLKLSNPTLLAEQLVNKMVSEGYDLFIGMEERIAVGIQQGTKILDELTSEGNLRLENLIAWSKTFNPDYEVGADQVREYWKSLLR